MSYIYPQGTIAYPGGVSAYQLNSAYPGVPYANYGYGG